MVLHSKQCFKEKWIRYKNNFLLKVLRQKANENGYVFSNEIKVVDQTRFKKIPYFHTKS